MSFAVIRCHVAEFFILPTVIYEIDWFFIQTYEMRYNTEIWPIVLSVRGG